MIFLGTLSHLLGTSNHQVFVIKQIPSVFDSMGSGILVIDRIDSAGYQTPSSCEYISFNGIHSSSGVIFVKDRGINGSTAQSHSAGSIVEILPPDVAVSMDWNSETSDRSNLKTWLEAHRP